MSRESVRARHGQSHRFFLRCWLSVDQLASHDMSEEEAAYSTVEHGGLYARLARNFNLPAELEQLSQPQRLRLVRAACRFAAGFALPEQFSRFLEKDVLEPEELEKAEYLLTQIDGLEAAIDLAVRLVESSLEIDRDLVAELAQARCVVAEMVQHFLVRPDLAACASRLVLLQREPRYLADGRPADWFTRLRELDRQLSSSRLDEFEFLGMGPNVATTAPALGMVLDEYAAWEAQFSTAAAVADNSVTPERMSLADRTFLVEGDEAAKVTVDFQLSPTSPTAEIQVLLAPAEKIRQYTGFELDVHGLPTRGEFSALAVGEVSTDKRKLLEQKENIRLFLLAGDGSRREVQLR